MSTISLSSDALSPACVFREPAQPVVDCYDVLEVCLAGGVSDFTDGKYLDDHNDSQTYQVAQWRQAEYLLDQLGCRPGEQILDIGCGYGRILQQAQQRELEAIGITVAPGQAAVCQRRGLHALVMDYRNLPQASSQQFGKIHGIVANGSLEHFAQLDDALADRVSQVYRELFEICRSLLNPGERLVTTAIHFREVGQADPDAIRQTHRAWPRGSFNYHLADVLQAFGGWYPEPGQLEHGADGTFALIAEEDGTHDYLLTSEYWLRQLKWSLATNPRVWWALAKKCRQAPGPLCDLMRCFWRNESWNWQFRGKQPPMCLLRQTWQAV
jgi:cyclopropane fatty-acyl-phospholipid synthase-like methyltransferase